MDVKSGTPYWTVKNGLLRHFRRLGTNARCDVAVVGAGITGALVADELTRRGYEVVVLDACEAGWGSTAASAALVQGALDTDLIDLAKIHGHESAVRAYRACADAVSAIAARFPAPETGHDAASLYFGRRGSECEKLRRDYEFRRWMGLDVDWVNKDDLQACYGLRARCAVLGRPAALIDPYRATHDLLAAACGAGARVHARTRVARLRVGARGVRLDTSNRLRIEARHVVVATSHAAQCLLPAPVARNRSTYALVTNPIDDAAGLRVLDAVRNLLICETARPCLYMRATGDGRLMIGGEDDDTDVPARRDARVAVKAERLLRSAHRRFPDLRLDAAFAWAGTFAETPDRLPYFGPHALTGNRVHYAMPCGGNGIAFAWIGARLIADLIDGREHPLASLFGFARMQACR
ncbi:MAG: FAD-binding oxidoreductase [Lysobacter sp.]|nr:FAD-binding oxidoreductase [Lysobacter sp.]